MDTHGTRLFMPAENIYMHCLGLGSVMLLKYFANIKMIGVGLTTWDDH